MVSLHTNVWVLRRGLSLSAGCLVVIGLALTALVVAGSGLHGRTLDESAADAELKQLVAGLQRGAPLDLAHANRTVYLATTHSVERRIGLTENWLQWGLGKMYPPLARTQNAERLMAGRLADCSERSQILKSLAELAGQRCRFVGLSGHVVLEVETPEGWQVADPDYGVVYPLGIKTLEERDSAPLIREKLAAAGYPQPSIDLYLGIVQSSEDNVVLPIGRPLSPRLETVERWCDRLALLLPLGLIVAGGALAWGANLADRRHSKRMRIVTQAACESELRPRPA